MKVLEKCKHQEKYFLGENRHSRSKTNMDFAEGKQYYFIEFPLPPPLHSQLEIRGAVQKKHS